MTLELRSRVPGLATALAAYNDAAITLRELKAALTEALRATPLDGDPADRVDALTADETVENARRLLVVSGKEERAIRRGRNTGASRTARGAKSCEAGLDDRRRRPSARSGEGSL